MQPLERLHIHYPKRRFRLVRNMGLMYVFDIDLKDSVDTTRWPQQLLNEIATKHKKLCYHDFTIVGGNIRLLD